VTTYEVLAAAVPALLVLGALFWSHIQQQATINRLEDRIAHLVAGTALLTDTTEGALRDIANEIGRLAAVTAGSRLPAADDDPRPAAGGGPRRPSVGARRGLPRTVRDTAAFEELPGSLDEAPLPGPPARRPAPTFRPVRSIAALEGLSALDDRTPSPTADARPRILETPVPAAACPAAPELSDTADYAYWK
jgi:hypothetical protein